MKIIGLTGGIGTGKSTVAGFLKELGAAVIDMDRVGHEAIQAGTAAFERIVAEFGREILATVQGHTILPLDVQALQPVHVVGYVHRVLGIAARLAGEIPGRPGLFLLWQNRSIGVQDRVVFLVTPWRQKALLAVIGVMQKTQGLVGMAGYDDLVTAERGTFGQLDFNLVCCASNRCNRR